MSPVRSNGLVTDTSLTTYVHALQHPLIPLPETSLDFCLDECHPSQSLIPERARDLAQGKQRIPFSKSNDQKNIMGPQLRQGELCPF